MMPSEDTTIDNVDVTQNSACSKKSQLEQFLTLHPQVEFLRCQWVDYSGILRARILPIHHGLSLAKGARRQAAVLAFQTTVNNEMLQEVDPREQQELVPDWESLSTRCAYHFRYATVMCFVKACSPKPNEPEWGFCPRKALLTVVDNIKKQTHGTILVGFEVEFQIMKRSKSGQLERFSNGMGRSAVAGLRDPCFPHIEEVIRILLKSGIDVGTFQTEGYRGQFEISLEPQSPMRAVDELVMVHDTLKSFFEQQGLVATMAPTPVAAESQYAGQHTHISVNPPTQENSFLAGMLSRLPALCALSLPYELSYERVRPYIGGHVVAWGDNNRAVPVRRIKSGHWELRFIDATANMYLTLASVLAAGLLGSSQNLPLSWPNANSLDEHFPKEAQALPKSLEESLQKLEYELPQFGQVLGSPVLDHYLTLKRAEMASLRAGESTWDRDLLSELL